MAAHSDLTPRANLYQWLDMVMRSGLLEKSGLHSFRSKNNLRGLSAFLLQGAELAEAAALDFTRSPSNERVYNSIIPTVYVPVGNYNLALYWAPREQWQDCFRKREDDKIRVTPRNRTKLLLRI